MRCWNVPIMLLNIHMEPLEEFTDGPTWPRDGRETVSFVRRRPNREMNGKYVRVRNIQPVQIYKAHKILNH